MALFARPTNDPMADPESCRNVLDAAMRVSQIAASAAPLPDALRSVVQTAVQLLGADQGSVMLVSDDGTHLVLVAGHGLPPEASLGSYLQVGEGVAGRVLASNAAMRLDDVDGHGFVNFVPKKRPIKSSVVVPLRISGRPVGVLNLAVSGERPHYTDGDVRVAQMFADHVAGLVHRARLHERAERRSSDLMALFESSVGLLGTLDVDSLLEEVLDGCSRLAGHDDGFACLFDPDTGELARGVFRGMDKVAIASLLEDPGVRAAAERFDTVAVDRPGGRVLAAGFRTPGGTRGLLLVRAGDGVPEDRANLLRVFGGHCASALGAAELHGELQRKETELSSIIHGVPIPLVLVDGRMRIAALNAAAETLFGVSALFAAGAPVEGGLGHPEIERLLRASGDVQAEVQAGNPPAAYKARVADVRIPGVPVGRVLIMDDVSAERALMDMQRDFVAVIGHELRTPLTIIKGFTKTLLRKLDRQGSLESARDALHTVEVKSQQLERLIEDLLYVSQIEGREAALRIERVDVVALVHGVADELLVEHPEREIVIDVPAGLSWTCDETKVALVLRHLVENGLKYSEAPQPVTVRAYLDGDDLRFDVQDRGVGIVSGDIQHIFERFRQLDGSSTRRHGGTGVGLYLCERLVSVQGGRIRVDSTWGKGSTFSFSLPPRRVPQAVTRGRSRLQPAPL